MELIIKPTSACNMCCDFCAASKIKAPSKNYIDNKIISIIDTIDPDCLIFTGGDPLCVSPDYYSDLIKRYPNKKIDMTSNLKEFYLNPDKWAPILKHPNVSVCTSFNYGNTRKWSCNEVYTESKFVEVMIKFHKEIGYMPPFIAVMDENNIDTAFQTIKLARKLGTRCRINNAMKMGKQGSYYPRYKVFEKWLEIIEAGLEKYEITCLERKNGKCPINSNLMCASTIRAVYSNINGNLVYSNCEDKLNLELANIELDKKKVLPQKSKINYKNLINKKCPYCELFNICNGCNTNREQAKENCPEYCSEMLKLKDRIIKTEWKL